MTWLDDYVAELHRRGCDVYETYGWRGRSNGYSWSEGKPLAQTNHHLVYPLEWPEDGAANLAALGHRDLSGPLCNEMFAPDGTIHMIAAGPANHAGRGRRDVLDRARRELPPLGLAVNVYGYNSDDYTGGNTRLWGRELQHPGDDTPYPDAQIWAMVQANAAMATVLGYTANRSHHHKEWSFRKIDLSWTGDLRGRIAEAMTEPTPPQPIPEDDMTPEQWSKIQAMSDKLDALDRRIPEPTQAQKALVNQPTVTDAVYGTAHRVNLDFNQGREAKGAISNLGTRLANLIKGSGR